MKPPLANLPMEYKKCFWEFPSKSKNKTCQNCKYPIDYRGTSKATCGRCRYVNKKVMHLVTVDRKNGNLACGCHGWYHYHTCWHVRRVQRLKLEALEGFKYERVWCSCVIQCSNTIMLPIIPLEEPFTMHFLITVIYDLIGMGHSLPQIKKLYDIIPKKWMERDVRDYIKFHGRLKPDMDVYRRKNQIFTHKPQGPQQRTRPDFGDSPPIQSPKNLATSPTGDRGGERKLLPLPKRKRERRK